jgi:hypothetical protein
MVVARVGRADAICHFLGAQAARGAPCGGGPAGGGDRRLRPRRAPPIQPPRAGARPTSPLRLQMARLTRNSELKYPRNLLNVSRLKCVCELLYSLLLF